MYVVYHLYIVYHISCIHCISYIILYIGGVIEIYKLSDVQGAQWNSDAVKSVFKLLLHVMYV